MTVLQRTDLTTSQKIQCAAAAVAGQHAHAHGSKTALSETYEISRPTVYAVGAAAQSVLRSHFESPLLQGAAVDVRVDDAQLRRAVVALRVLAPNAIRPIEDLVPLLYPGPDGPNVHIWTSCDEGNADNPEVSHLETDDNLPGREHGLG